MRFLKLLSALLAVVFAAYLWLAPGYLEVDIPVASHKGGMGFWWESHRTRLAYADSSGVLYVHRQVGSTSDAHDWKTAAEVFAYFDEQLRQRGWTPAVAGHHDPVAPESRVLGADNHKQYYRLEDKRHTAYLTLSIWPRGGTAYADFHVALTTANESLLMRIARRFD
jgi:hypothetical protein